MDQLVKQRVVGAVVLAALAVIFIPVLLEGPADESMPEVRDIPRPMNDLREGRIEPFQQHLTLPEETVTTVVIEEATEAPAPEPPARAEPAAGTPAVAEPAPQPPEPAPEPEPLPATQPVSPRQGAVSPRVQGWVVQVGSFSNQSNALGLRDKLRAAGYAAFVEQVKLGSGIAYRVRVGPERDRKLAEAQQQKIARDQGITGRVMSHP